MARPTHWGLAGSGAPMRSVLKYMTQWSPNRATLGAQNWLGLAAHAGAVGMALVVTAFLSHRLYGRDRSVSRVTGARTWLLEPYT